MKKIGVLNCSHIRNYGSVLQSYAMEKVVKKISNSEVTSIRYKQNKDFRYLRNYLPQVFEKEIVELKIRGLKRKLYLKLINKELGRKITHREQYFDCFVKNHFNFSPTCNKWEELCALAGGYDAFILGSDQVWHPINLGSHFYTMEWIPDGLPKITYAASFGVGMVPHSQAQKTKKYLERLDEISVREQRGAEIIKALTGRNASIVADPTLLLERSEWETLCKPIPKDEFIFCYFLGNNEDARQYAKKLGRETGLKLLCITFMDEINKIDIGFGDMQLFDAGPGEFLSYIRDAKYVVTDSFHGSVFSIIFEKKFIVFNRFKSEKKGSTNSRIDTLLNALELAERRLVNIDDTEKALQYMDKTIVYGNVRNKVDKLKNKSIQYLDEAIRKHGLTD